MLNLGFILSNVKVWYLASKGAIGKPAQKKVTAWQLLGPVTKTEILAPELAGDQSEMVVYQFVHKF